MLLMNAVREMGFSIPSRKWARYYTLISRGFQALAAAAIGPWRQAFADIQPCRACLAPSWRRRQVPTPDYLCRCNIAMPIPARSRRRRSQTARTPTPEQTCPLSLGPSEASNTAAINPSNNHGICMTHRLLYALKLIPTEVLPWLAPLPATSWLPAKTSATN